MGHGEATEHKENRGHHRGPLQITDAHNGVPQRASPGVAGTKAHQKAPKHEKDQSGSREKLVPGKNLGG